MVVRRWSRAEILKPVEDITEKENLLSKQSFYFKLFANPYLMSQYKPSLFSYLKETVSVSLGMLTAVKSLIF